MQSTAKADQKHAAQQQSWVFKATCKLTQQRTAITSDELQQWDILFGDLFAVLEREGLLGDQQQAVTDAQSHALPRDIASLTQVDVISILIIWRSPLLGHCLYGLHLLIVLAYFKSSPSSPHHMVHLLHAFWLALHASNAEWGCQICFASDILCGQGCCHSVVCMDLLPATRCSLNSS